ncbi:MAG: class F sortase [Chloroflexi bacterium]|nr:class F sortase [Chloroflexota bacterium]
MSSRVPRRRALARGFVVAGGLAIWLAALPQMVGAQAPGPDAETPLPDPPVPGLPLVTGNDPLTEPSELVVMDPDEDDGTMAAPEPPTPVVLGVTPVKLTIPALGVEAVVEAVGQEADGAMATPTDPDDVAWYAGSPGMGVPGNVVFAAHVNWDNRLRPFGLLHQLEPGDVVQVIDAEGRGFEYVVKSSHWVRAEGAPVEEIFAPTPMPTVTLITCGGEFVASRREYLDRLIVKAVGA